MAQFVVARHLNFKLVAMRNDMIPQTMSTELVICASDGDVETTERTNRTAARAPQTSALRKLPFRKEARAPARDDRHLGCLRLILNLIHILLIDGTVLTNTSIPSTDHSSMMNPFSCVPVF